MTCEKRYILSIILFLMLASHALAQSGSYSYVMLRTMTNGDASTWLDHIGYDDGLGQPYQQVDAGITPGHADLVTLHEYDGHRRPLRTWLPGIGSNGACLDSTVLKASARTLNSDAKPYATSNYEPSPLNRLAREYLPGNDWYQHFRYRNHFVSSDNTNVSFYRVMHLTMMGGSLFFSGFSNTTKLVTVMHDEDNTQHLEFTDKDGNVVVRRTIYDGEQLTTYYVYDDSGQLRFVLPPEAACYYESSLSSGQFISSTDDCLLKYGYEYRYDGRGNCIYKRLPGCEPVYYIYDKAGRCILSQTGVQRSQGTWTYSIPDVFGREVLSGTCHNTLSYSSEPLHGVTVTATLTTAANAYYGYSISNLTLSSDTLYTATFYDDYAFIGMDSIPSSLCYSAPPSGGFGTQGLPSPKGLPTGTVTARLGTSGVTGYDYEAVYYDDKGLVVQRRNTNHMGGNDSEYMGYSFTGQVLDLYRQHSTAGLTYTEQYAYTYDHAGRLLTTTHRLNGNSAVTIRSNSYDNLGRLSSTTRGGTLTTNYTYNVRSWVSSINSGSLFGETLYYNESHGDNTPSYTGNVSAMEWTTGSTTRGYNFSYDGFSRLTQAVYRENNNANGHYDTQYSYDRMGNITGLTRNGLQDDNSYGQIDNLSCQYDGNRLTRITDAAVSLTYQGAFDFSDQSNATTEFLYDENGNMTQDLNKGIESIQYNLLNLPQKINFERGKSTMDIQHLYDARGRKLQAIESLYRMNIHPHFLPDVGGRDLVPSVSFRPFLSYLSKIDYCGNFIHDNNHIKVLFDGGYVTMSDNTPVYHYYLQDHLGNNRVVVKQDGTVEQVNHYYPYGGVMGESTSGDVQRYKYNGKELDRMHGLDWYDYGARHYDAAVGSWPTMDPLSEKYYSQSPYNYCGGNPIRFVDINGGKIVDPNGKVVRITWNSNNSLVFSNNANPSIIRVANAMNLTVTGRSQLQNLIQSDIYVTIDLSNAINGNGQEYTYGETIQGNFEAKKNYGTYYKNGKFGITEAHIKIYLGSIEESIIPGSGFKLEGLTTEQAIGAVAGHESVHAINKDEIHKDKEYELDNNGKARPDKEFLPNLIEQKIIKEYKYEE